MKIKIFAKEEFIGQQVTIQDCKDPEWLNKSGKIVDETKNTFLIEFENKRKRIAKSIAVFRFEECGKIILDGSRINYRPEDRIKKAR
jgi:ribonuclease P protein subunit POP4